MEMLLFLPVLLIAFCGWGIACTEKTYRQQAKLINDIHDAIVASCYRKNYWPVVDAVPFDAHMWRLITFRDPWAIYPPELAEVRKAVT